MLLRLDPEVHEAVARWASDELRSTNAHVEFLLRRAVIQAGRLRETSLRRTGTGGDRDAERDSDTDGGSDR